MRAIINKNGIETKIFAKTIEDGVIDQITTLCNYYAYENSKIRIMPDCHQGKGCTIGTTIKLTDKVTPNLTGVDLNCGMLVANLGKIDIDLNKLDEIVNEVTPCGFKVHDEALVDFSVILSNLYCKSVIDVDFANKSIGSLGGGNHFIELDTDDEGNKYLVIHSGSRNLGVRICNYFQKLAANSLTDRGGEIKALAKRYKEEGREREISEAIKKIPKLNVNKDLAYLEGNNMRAYLHDVNIAGMYASLNRQTMAKLILEKLDIDINTLGDSMFETLHNYIDTSSMILRKGAVSAQKGERLIIPMNMRDGSLICIGKGNSDWNYSAPHGAGRLMSRRKAIDTLSMEEYRKEMQGIASSSVCESTIDESPMAYKPTEEIIECIKDTVDIEKIIKPIYNFKAK